jgi:hypothetical protein
VYRTNIQREQDVGEGASRLIMKREAWPVLYKRGLFQLQSHDSHPFIGVIGEGLAVVTVSATRQRLAYFLRANRHPFFTAGYSITDEPPLTAPRALVGTSESAN